MEEEESNGQQTFFDALLKQNNGKISVLVYRRLTHTEQNTYTTTSTIKLVVRKLLFPPCLVEHIPLSPIKMT